MCLHTKPAGCIVFTVDECDLNNYYVKMIPDIEEGALD